MKPIFVVEDDEVDFMMIERAFQEIKIHNPIKRFKNGLTVLEELTIGTIKPCFILLDLNMPKMNGIELIEKLRTCDQHSKIKTIVLTTSTEHEELKKSLEAEGNQYMIKSLDYEAFVNNLKTTIPDCCK